MRQILSRILLAALLAPLLPVGVTVSHARVPIIFPVLGGADYWNDFGVPRSGGRTHIGNDLFAPKHTPLLATEDGRVQFIAYPERSWGMSVSLRGDSGWRYQYIHVNNDRPGTDDNSALPYFAYAPDITEGARVRAGQIIGYMGDSGNAEHTRSHLHFEMRDPSGNVQNPFASLQSARVFTNPQPAAVQQDEILPYRELTLGGHIAVGNFDNDSRSEFVTAPRTGGGPHVRLFDDDSESMDRGFFAYAPDYPGGLDVAAGDLDGDGIDEIVTGAGPGGTAHIRTFTAAGEPYGVEFLAYPRGFNGGASVAAADIDNDGVAEIITGAGPGGTPHVKIWSADGTLRREFLAYDEPFRGGVDVAAAPGAVVTSPLRGGGPHIKIWNTTGGLTRSFFAYDQAFTGGVRISARATTTRQVDDRYQPTPPEEEEVDLSQCDIVTEVDNYGRATIKRVCPDQMVLSTHNTDKDEEEESDRRLPAGRQGLEILTGPASDGGGDFRLFNAQGQRITKGSEFDRWWIGGYDVALADGAAWVISGQGPSPTTKRRTSVRPLSPRFW